MKRLLAVITLLWAPLIIAATWSSFNGVTVGGSTGNVSKLNGGTIGTSSGNIGTWNGLVSPSAAPAWSAGFDIRSTSGFVTDPSGYAFTGNATANPWPTTLTMTTTGTTAYAGWQTSTGISPTCSNSPTAQDLSATIPRLAGHVFLGTGSLSCFYIQLGNGPGTYNVYLGWGQPSGSNTSTIKVGDGYTSSGTATSVSATKTLTLVSGPNPAAWTKDYIGNTITFNGSPLVVVTVPTSTTMTVATDPGTQATPVSWTYGSTGTTTTVATSTVTTGDQYGDANANLTTGANWVAASAHGGVVLSKTFSTNVMYVQMGSSSGFTTLNNIFVTQ